MTSTPSAAAAPETAQFDLLAVTEAHARAAWAAVDKEVFLSGLFDDQLPPATITGARARSVLHWLLGRLETAEIALEEILGGRNAAVQLADALHRTAEAEAFSTAARDTLRSIAREHPTSEATCPRCGVPAPCRTAQLVAAHPH